MKYLLIIFFICILCSCETLEERQRRQIRVSKSFCNILHEEIYGNKTEPVDKRQYVCVFKRTNNNSITSALRNILSVIYTNP